MENPYKNLESRPSGMNVEGMGGVGQEAQQNIQNILSNSKFSSANNNLSTHEQLMKSNGQKGNLS